MSDVDRIGAAFADNDRRSVQKRADLFHIQRRRHHEYPQVFPQAGLRIERQRQPEIRFQRALVKFVENHEADIREFRVVEDHAREHAFGHHLYARARGDAVVEPHAIADRSARFFAEQACHARGGRTRRQPARFQQNDLATLKPRLAQKVERHDRRLACARRRAEHCRIMILKSIAKLRQHRADGELGQIADQGRIPVMGKPSHRRRERPASTLPVPETRESVSRRTAPAASRFRKPGSHRQDPQALPRPT